MFITIYNCKSGIIYLMEHPCSRKLKCPDENRMPSFPKRTAGIRNENLESSVSRPAKYSTGERLIGFVQQSGRLSDPFGKMVSVPTSATAVYFEQLHTYYDMSSRDRVDQRYRKPILRLSQKSRAQERWNLAWRSVVAIGVVGHQLPHIGSAIHRDNSKDFFGVCDCHLRKLPPFQRMNSSNRTHATAFSGLIDVRFALVIAYLNGERPIASIAGEISNGHVEGSVTGCVYNLCLLQLTLRKSLGSLAPSWLKLERESNAGRFRLHGSGLEQRCCQSPNGSVAGAHLRVTISGRSGSPR